MQMYNYSKPFSSLDGTYSIKQNTVMPDREIDRVRWAQEVLNNARKYDEKHSDMTNRYNDPSVRGAQVAALAAIAAGGRVPPQLLEYFRELRDLHDLRVWIDMFMGEGGSIKKHKKEKRRRHTKRRRPTKKR